jgi:hypothetical protein
MTYVADPQKTPPTTARVAGLKSEWWPDLFRNAGRLQIGIPAGFTSEHPAGLNRNPHARLRGQNRQISDVGGEAPALHCSGKGRAPDRQGQRLPDAVQDLHGSALGLCPIRCLISRTGTALSLLGEPRRRRSSP